MYVEREQKLVVYNRVEANEKGVPSNYVLGLIMATGFPSGCH